MLKKIIRALKRRLGLQKWRVVRQYQIAANADGHKVQLFIYLHESNLGDRKWTCGANVSVYRLETKIPYLDIYLKTIYPWLNGNYDPDIPSFDGMDAIWVADKLSR